MEERRIDELDAKLLRLNLRRESEDAATAQAFQERLTIGWLLHDNALEGIVLSQAEIHHALSSDTSSDRAREAMYRGIRDHKAAIDLMIDLAHAQQQHQHQHQHPPAGAINVALLRHLYDVLTRENKKVGSPYRGDKLLHRIYTHDIVPADQIPPRLRKLCEALDGELQPHHPVVRAARVHFDFMSIYPWTQNNGKIARLLMNLLLLRDGYPPAVISGSNRRRYYESLRTSDETLTELIRETLLDYCRAATQFLDGLALASERPV